MPRWKNGIVSWLKNTPRIQGKLPQILSTIRSRYQRMIEKNEQTKERIRQRDEKKRALIETQLREKMKWHQDLRQQRHESRL
jgi:hypothetical protein